MLWMSVQFEWGTRRIAERTCRCQGLQPSKFAPPRHEPQRSRYQQNIKSYLDRTSLWHPKLGSGSRYSDSCAERGYEQSKAKQMAPFNSRRNRERVSTRMSWDVRSPSPFLSKLLILSKGFDGPLANWIL